MRHNQSIKSSKKMNNGDTMRSKVQFEKKKEVRQNVSIRLEPSTIERLKVIATKNGVSFTDVIEVAVKKTYK